MGILPDLFLTFAKIGLFTFGGGYAMIALIEDACVEKKQWITHDEMMNVTVIAESTPGPIAINCATYVGYKQKGLAGAIAATVGMVLPSFCIIFLISMFLDNFLEITWIAHAFRGIRIAVGMVNLATYVGSSQAGFAGALIATTAVVLPSFIIILLIMILLKKLLKNPYFQAFQDPAMERIDNRR